MGQIMKAFQQDLKNGMTLEDALIKHNLSFKQAVEMSPVQRTNKKRQKDNVRKNMSRYIQLQGKSYHVRKTINGKTVSFGTFATLEDAIKVRDYLIEHGWNIVKMRQACKEYEIKQSGWKHD